MRIHELTFQAIGPYATQQHLDFTQLDDAGLFLLDGPTGAGKSTILDIITFALYGKPDDDRKNTELHSTLAAPGVPPTLTLDISFGTRRFVIDRTLQHFAPRRGAQDPTDLVNRPTTMNLTEIVAGEPRQLSTRVDEAQQILRGVIGLSREQFTSVVLLPQGEFARFLKASSKEREAILQQLFNTHRFDEIGDYLTAKAKELQATVESDRQLRDTLRAALAKVIRPDEPEHLELQALDDTTLINHVEQLMDTQETAAQQRVQQCAKTLQTAQQTLQQLRQQQEQLEEATQYQRRRTAHKQQTSVVEAAKLQLLHHERAQPVISAQDDCDKATTHLENVLEQLTHSCNAAEQDPSIVQWAAGYNIFTVDQSQLQILFDGWKIVEARAIRALEHLTQHEKTATTITVGTTELQQWETEAQQLQTKLEQLDQQLHDLTAQYDTDTRQAEELAGAEHTLETAQQVLEAATLRQTAARKAQSAKDATDQAKTQRDTTGQAADDALEHAQDLMRRRIEAAAAFLAHQLEEDQPCQVCGSTNHPEPADTQDTTEISNDAVQRAQKQATTARRIANDAEANYQTQLQKLHELQTEAGGLTLDLATEEVVTAQQAVTSNQAQVATLQAVRQRLADNHTATQKLHETKTSTEQRYVTVCAQITTRRTELLNAQQTLDTALGEYDTVADLRAAIEPAHNMVATIVRQNTSVATALATHTTAQQRVTQVLTESQRGEHPAFTSAQQAATHILETTDELETRVRQWTTEGDKLIEKACQSAVIAGLQLLDDGVTAPTCETLEHATQAQQEAQTALSEANRAHGSIQATRQQCQIHQQQLAELSQHAAEQLATFEELEALRDVVAGRGENGVNMPLRSFVLAGWLEHVAANASERLTGMTGGRYELRHAVGQGGRGLSGLNLEVIDHLNDTTRTPATLSGGETFMASLALALGLADAVQAQAGGVAMDTLFIDEGFGSLDTDTLEDVMGVLNALQDDGRLIGLVSHVDSMKQQIPHRIQVQKAQTGSTATILGPDVF